MQGTELVNASNNSTKNAASPPTRRLGQTDMNITRVGFGAWAIGVKDAVIETAATKELVN
jgi:hypothetical protein